MPQGRILLGWMQRDQAIEFLTKHCHFDAALDDAAAEAMWNEYRNRVDALPPRQIAQLQRHALDATEQRIARQFTQALRGQPGFNVASIVKVDVHRLIARQLYVNTDKSDEHWQQAGSRGAFVRRCLPHAPRPVQFRINVNPPNYVVELPHAECGFAYIPNTTTFAVQQFMHYVTVVEHANRMVLWAGYHRAYALATATQAVAPDATERTLVSALAVNTPLSPSEATLATRLAPPLLGDFLADGLFMPVTLRRKRYEYQISAKLQWIDA